MRPLPSVHPFTRQPLPFYQPAFPSPHPSLPLAGRSLRSLPSGGPAAPARPPGSPFPHHPYSPDPLLPGYSHGGGCGEDYRTGPDAADEAGAGPPGSGVCPHPPASGSAGNSAAGRLARSNCSYFGQASGREASHPFTPLKIPIAFTVGQRYLHFAGENRWGRRQRRIYLTPKMSALTRNNTGHRLQSVFLPVRVATP